jgi:competence protein ComGC
MNPLREPLRNERGIGLVVALLVLLVLSVLAAVLMMSINTNTKIAGHSMRESQALNTAEAGIAEALSQVRAQNIMTSLTNPRAVGQIYNVAAGSVPTPGNADSQFVATAQPAGAWLDYSKPSRGPDVLTVTYLTDPGKTVIYKYDANQPANPIQTVSGLPIMVITSVGRKGADARKIVAQVIVKPIVANIKAALAANMDIDFVGNAVICGYNHRYATPVGWGANGRGNAPDCFPYETGSGNMPSSWTTSTSNPGGGGSQTFSPVIPPNQTNQVGFYPGPWDALGMTQAEFFNWIGPAKSSWLPNGIGYYAGDLGIHGGSGEGFTYVGGDLTINSGFNYKGLLYVEGNLLMNGQAWVLGGIIVKGTTSVKQNGGSTLLFSADAITQALSRYGSQFATLSWIETRL